MSSQGGGSGAHTGLRIANKYVLGRKIGSGSFGDIYLGEQAAYPFLLQIREGPEGNKTSFAPHYCAQVIM